MVIAMGNSNSNSHNDTNSKTTTIGGDSWAGHHAGLRVASVMGWRAGWEAL